VQHTFANDFQTELVSAFSTKTNSPLFKPHKIVALAADGPGEEVNGEEGIDEPELDEEALVFTKDIMKRKKGENNRKGNT